MKNLLGCFVTANELYAAANCGGMWVDRMKNQRIQCYLANINKLGVDALFEHAYQSLPREGLWLERRERINQYRNKKDKERSLGVGLLLLYALKVNKINSISLVKNSYGKLLLPKDESFYFNLSHSGDYVACSVGSVENGIDIEHDSVENIDIAKRFFCENEYNHVMNQGGDMFARIWTLKESYIKMKGKGLSIPLNSFEVYPGVVIEDKIMSKWVELPMETQSYVVSEENIKFREFSFEGYHLCMCAKGEIEEKLILVDFPINI